MDNTEYTIKKDEIRSLIAQREYAQAAEIADTIDWRRVRSVMMLCTISDLYKINRRYEDAKNMLLLAYEYRPGGRSICYSLCELCIKMEEFVEAVAYYKEFVQAAPKDPDRYVLQYKLYEAQDVSLEERIEVLKELKQKEYREKWAYELAYLYHRIGQATLCVEECDELILWFGEGKYVYKAMELKMLHQPLSPSQQEKYDQRPDGIRVQENVPKAAKAVVYPQAREQNQGYAQSQVHEQSQGYGQSQVHEQSRGYGQSQVHEQNQGYGQSQAHEQNQGYAQSQAYEQNQGYGQSQAHDQSQSYGQAYEQSQSYAQSQAYEQNQGYGQVQVHEQSQSYAQSQAYERSQGYTQSRAYEQSQGFVQPQEYGQSQGFTQPQEYEQSNGYEQSQGYEQPEYMQPRASSRAYENSQDYGHFQEEALPQSSPEPEAAERFSRMQAAYREQDFDDTQNLVSAEAEQGNSDKAAESDIQVPIMDMGQYNTINLQAEIAAGLQEVLEKEGSVHDDEITRSIIAPMLEPDTGRMDVLDVEELDEDDLGVDAGEVEETEVFFGETGEINSVRFQGIKEIVPEIKSVPETVPEMMPETVPEMEAAVRASDVGGDTKVFEIVRSKNMAKPQADGRTGAEAKTAASGRPGAEAGSMASGRPGVEAGTMASGRPGAEAGSMASGRPGAEAGSMAGSRPGAEARTMADSRPEAGSRVGASGQTAVPNAVQPGNLPDVRQVADETAELVMNQMRMENKAEAQAMIAQPPKELANVLSQESDGQISLVMPEREAVEKQITGQMSIEDILAEWERIKQESVERRKAELQQRVLQQTGNMFTEFEAAVRDGLLERLENEIDQELSDAAGKGEQEELEIISEARDPGDPEDLGEIEEIQEPDEAASAIAETQAAGEPEGEPIALVQKPEVSQPEGEPVASVQEPEVSQPGKKPVASVQEIELEASQPEGEPVASAQEPEASQPEGKPMASVQEPEVSQPEGLPVASVQEPEASQPGKKTVASMQVIEPEAEPVAGQIYEPAAEEAVADKAAKQETVINESAGQEAAANESAINEAARQETAISETATDEPAISITQPEEMSGGASQAYMEPEVQTWEPEAATQPVSRPEAAAQEPEAAVQPMSQPEVQEWEPAATAQAPGSEAEFAAQPVYEPVAEEAATSQASIYASAVQDSDIREPVMQEQAWEPEPEAVRPAAARRQAEPVMPEPEQAASGYGDYEPEEAGETAEEAGEMAEAAAETTGQEAAYQPEEPERPPVRKLTREERELYAPYIQSRSAREQLVKAIDNISMAAYTGNIVITGEEGMNTITLAKNMIREVQMMDRNFSGKVAKISGQGLNQRNVKETLEQLKNGALIIEKASGIQANTAAELARFLRQDNVGIIIVLEDTKKAIARLFAENPRLRGSFTSWMDVEALSNDTLASFGMKYARQKEFSIDDLGMLALHKRIEELQTIDHVVTVVEVKDIVDNAIRHASKKSLGHFMDILLAKRYDEEDMVILTEKDFV